MWPIDVKLSTEPSVLDAGLDICVPRSMSNPSDSGSRLRTLTGPLEAFGCMGTCAAPEACTPKSPRSSAEVRPFTLGWEDSTAALSLLAVILPGGGGGGTAAARLGGGGGGTFGPSPFAWLEPRPFLCPSNSSSGATTSSSWL